MSRKDDPAQACIGWTAILSSLLCDTSNIQEISSKLCFIRPHDQPASLCQGVTELPSTPKIKLQSSITNPHSETGHFHIKSMPKCGKFGAAPTAGWGAGAAIFSPVGRVVLLQKGGPPPDYLPLFRLLLPCCAVFFGRATSPNARQLSLICFLEAGRHTLEVLLQLLCFFGKDVIGACSPFVSRNRVSCLFRVIVDADNLGILCFVSPP